MQSKSLDEGKVGKVSLWDELSFVDLAKLKVLPMGSASIPPPEFFKDAISQAPKKMEVFEYQYTDWHGSIPLRKSIVKNFASVAHYPNADAEKNVIVGCGAVPLIHYILTALIADPDDELLSFEPYYPYHFIALQGKGKVRFARLIGNEKTKNFEIDYEDFKSKLGPKTKVVILCNPNNPTSKVFSGEEYAKLTEILKDYPDVTIVEDAAYCAYLRDGAPLKYFHEFGDNIQKTFTVFSGGKIMNATGVRVGWAFGPESLVSKLKSSTALNFPASVIEQKVMEDALALALDPFDKSASFWAHVQTDTHERIKYVQGNLDLEAFSAMAYDGTYYMVLSIEAIAGQIEDKYYYRLDCPHVKEPYRDRAFSRKLMLECDVGVLPLSVLYGGSQKDDRFIRIAANRNWDELAYLKKTLEGFTKNT